MTFNEPIPNFTPEFYRAQQDAADPVLPHNYEWYVIENINDSDRRIDHVLPLDEAILLYVGLDCGDKRLGVTKDDIAAVDLAIRWNGREWLSEDRLRMDSFKNDPVVADACARLQRMLEAAPATGEEDPRQPKDGDDIPEMCKEVSR